MIVSNKPYYAIYNINSGEIRQIIQVNEDELSNQFDSNLEDILIISDPNIEGYVSNGAIVPFPPKPSRFHTFNFNTKEWLDPRSIEEVKQYKWKQIKAKRDEYEFGFFTWNNLIFDCDSSSQQRIIGAAILAQMDPNITIDWTLADNTTITLTSSDILLIAKELSSHVVSCHETAKILRHNIESATTITDINNIVWPQSL